MHLQQTEKVFTNNVTTEVSVCVNGQYEVDCNEKNTCDICVAAKSLYFNKSEKTAM